jgi:hypothetical protein
VLDVPEQPSPRQVVATGASDEMNVGAGVDVEPAGLVVSNVWMVIWAKDGRTLARSISGMVEASIMDIVVLS